MYVWGASPRLEQGEGNDEPIPHVSDVEAGSKVGEQDYGKGGPEGHAPLRQEQVSSAAERGGYGQIGDSTGDKQTTPTSSLSSSVDE